ncbi:MAG: hypothetical protein QM784_08725, partial [Polyangiaceae bacterium]
RYWHTLVRVHLKLAVRVRVHPNACRAGLLATEACRAACVRRRFVVSCDVPTTSRWGSAGPSDLESTHGRIRPVASPKCRESADYAGHYEHFSRHGGQSYRYR